MIQRELTETHRAIANVNRLNGIQDPPSQCQTLPLRGKQAWLHLIAARGRSKLAVQQFGQVVLPGVIRCPGEWLFLIEPGPAAPDPHYRDQYRLAMSVARWLRLALPEKPFVATVDETVIESAGQRSLPASVRPDDFYGAVCYDSLPKKRTVDIAGKGLEAARIHEPANPQLEAVRLIRQFNWTIAIDRLTDIVTRVQQRIENECVGMLEEFYDLQVRPLLTKECKRLNRHRLRAVLRQHPAQNHVLILIAEHHSPLVLRTTH